MVQQRAETMKAIAIWRFGGLSELKEYDRPKPEPAADEVLLRVRAAGVGSWDSQRADRGLLAQIADFPLILGGRIRGRYRARRIERDASL